MAKTNLTALFTSVALLLSVAACGPSLVITNVDYSQPIESVISPDADNTVNDQRYGISFSIAPVLEEEGVASVEEVRLIRNNNGFYFLTAAGFNHVYVFAPDSGELQLSNKIEITEEGLERPALNQREDHIEVIDRATGDSFRVNEDGRIGG